MVRQKAAAAQGAKKKKAPTKAYQLAKPLSEGEVLKDLRKGEWRVGKPIGRGGFGLLYLADENTGKAVGQNSNYVLKIEPHSNGPLFMELAFYQRCAKAEDIQQWMTKQKLKLLGIPKFVASGHHDDGQQKCRFMVMERFGTDLQKIFEENGKKFSTKTVCILALRLLECLEYIHSKGYAHADIKASNLLLGHGKRKNQVFLVDYGLAQTFCTRTDGEHRTFKKDPKRKHDGTIEFTSRDAHDGVAPSRRSDLEILGYCLVQWLCCQLPWENKLGDQDYVMNQKSRHMKNIPAFLSTCFPSGGYPDVLATYLKYVSAMEYEEQPDYALLKQMFHTTLRKLGSKDEILDFSVKPSKQSRGKACSSEEDESAPVKKKGKGKQTASAVSPKSPLKVKSPRATPSKAKSPRTPIHRVKSPKQATAVVTSPKARTPKPGGATSPKATYLSKGSINGDDSGKPAPSRKRSSQDVHGSEPRFIKKSKVRKVMSSVATQTSPGLKGLRRSRKK